MLLCATNTESCSAGLSRRIKRVSGSTQYLWQLALHLLVNWSPHPANLLSYDYRNYVILVSSRVRPELHHWGAAGEGACLTASGYLKLHHHGLLICCWKRPFLIEVDIANTLLFLLLSRFGLLFLIMVISSRGGRRFKWQVCIRILLGYKERVQRVSISHINMVL